MFAKDLSNKYFPVYPGEERKVSAQPPAADAAGGWAETSTDNFFEYLRRKLSLVNLTIDQITRGSDHSEF